MPRHKISFLVPDISSPVLGPVTVLAKILQDAYDVQIVGPDMGSGVCAMYQGSFDYTVVATPLIYRFPEYFRDCRKLEKALQGDILIAVKAYANTVPVVLRAARKRGVKAAVYLDEWDGALWRMMSPTERAVAVMRHVHHPLENMYYPLVERLIPRLDLVLSTTTFLKHRFGGHIVHMGVDGDTFKPQPSHMTKALKSELELDGKKLVVFGGVVRPHKGIEVLAEALAMLGDPDVMLLIVGPETEHVRALIHTEEYASYIRCTGAVPKDQMPGYLGLADIIVIPMVDNLLAQTQMPCKIFEAMAMGKPVIVSDVSDLSDVVEGCGRVVPPGDVNELVEAIREIVYDREAMRAMGDCARQRCLEKYERAVTRQTLIPIVDELLAGAVHR